MRTDARIDTTTAEWRKVCRVKPINACMDSSMEEIVFDMTRRGDSPSCLFCAIGPGDVLNFHDLRRFLQEQSSIKSYAITVRCYNGGNVTLQWPLRAAGLNYISVSNCLLVNYTADYFDKSINQVPDTLRYYSITNCVMYIDVIDFMNVTNNVNLVTKAAKCGPEEHLFAAINRNISYQFKTIPDSIIEEVDANMSSHTPRNYHRGVSVSPITCNYTQLLLIDQSKATSLGSKHDSVLLQNSNYPVLRTLNLSASSLTELPERLDDWRLYFPRLKHLDLTYNFIKEFQTVMDYGMESEDPSVGLLDLRYNNITTITLIALMRIQHHRFVKVDIRNNPYICDCHMADFVNFASNNSRYETKFGVVGQYKYLRDLKCASPPSLKGRIIFDLSLNELGCTTVKTIDVTIYPIALLAFVTGILVIYLLLTMRQQVEMALSLFRKLKQLCFRTPEPRHEEEREPNMIGLETT
ncbi:Trophoblast glycoprotein [Mizuhopecten yessoensis]|uniref:Trophoblast glycoprotein n=1 Tax=Mizuhopecten yessoensis TaxID=6573 RepID=A0A210QHF6_MIZYE|nr:Trophoblast glycoprotein [Mizuhopecten yessoensis]